MVCVTQKLRKQQKRDSTRNCTTPSVWDSFLIHLSGDKTGAKEKISWIELYIYKFFLNPSLCLIDMNVRSGWCVYPCVCLRVCVRSSPVLDEVYEPRFSLLAQHCFNKWGPLAWQSLVLNGGRAKKGGLNTPFFPRHTHRNTEKHTHIHKYTQKAGRWGRRQDRMKTWPWKGELALKIGYTH